MTLERPPRLKDGELGAILRAADRAEVSPERLAHNASRIKTLIAAGTTTALWKLLVVLGLLVAVAVPVVSRLVRTDDAEPPPAVVASAGADAGVAATVPDAALADPDAAITVIEPDAARPPERRQAVRVAAAPPDAGTAVDAAEARPSDLPIQIQLYNDARAAAGTGDFGAAIDRIDDLLRRFPSTQLRPDAELTRADLLARANRLVEAAHAFEQLARDDAHRGRRGELLRTLGDLYRKLDDCKRAVDAFTRALAERLNDRDRADAQRGRDRCTAR
jgi:TolA-binding protein